MPKLLYVLSHPIQYQSPLLRYLNEHAPFELEVLYLCDLSLRGYYDNEFKELVEWDVPLVTGYSYRLSKSILTSDSLSFLNPLNPKIFKELNAIKPDAVWLHGWGYLSNFLVVLWCWFTGTPFFMRGEANLDLVQKPSSIKSGIRNVILKALFAKASGFFAIGKKNADFYKFLGVDPQLISWVPYCIDNSFFYSDEVLKKRSTRGSDARTTFLFAAKFTVRKRALETARAFIEAYPIVGEAQLVMAGSGEQLDAVKAEVARRNRPDVILLGFQNQNQLRDLIKNADVFILASVDEPWGLGINEAMAGGCAIITTKFVGCVDDLVRHKVNGYVTNGTQEDLVSAFNFVKQDRDKIEKFKEKSLQIIAKYDFKSCLKGIVKALKKTGM